MANLVVATVGWLTKLTPTPTIELTPPRSNSPVMNPGWLSRHSSRPLKRGFKAHEPYVDLSPLDLTRRH